MSSSDLSQLIQPPWDAVRTPGGFQVAQPPVKFLDIALPAVRRWGFSIIPRAKAEGSDEGKQPLTISVAFTISCTGTDKTPNDGVPRKLTRDRNVFWSSETEKTFLGGKPGAFSRTDSEEGVCAFAEHVPENTNYSICSDKNFTILESDDEETFRKLVREISLRMYGKAHELPPTLTSYGRPNRPHWFYRRTCEATPAPRAAGIFEWRHNNQYVAGAGSTHHSGSIYAFADPDQPIAGFPNSWLPEVLAEIARTAKVHRGKTGIKGAPDRNGYQMLLRAYLDRGEDPERMFGLDLAIDDGQHYTINSALGFLHNGKRDKDCLIDLATRLWDEYCVGRKPRQNNDGDDTEIPALVDYVLKRTPFVPAPRVCITGGNSAETQKWLDEINAENSTVGPNAAARGNTAHDTLGLPKIALPFFSDQALAEGFTRTHKDQIAYLDCGKWATYQDGLWHRDEKELVANHRAGQFLMSSILPEVDKRITEPKQAGPLKSRLCSANTQANVVKLAKQRPGIFHRLEEFDRDEFIIGAPSGKVIDLHTGKTRTAIPTDLIMKSVSVVPSNAPCPRWEKFVKEITDGNDELAKYLHRMAGSWLTASPKDHALTIWHGAGGNGKGTFISVAQQILGPYSTTIPVDSLVTKKSGDTDLGGVAMLCGARLAVAQQGETTRRFNAGLLKTLTGGDRLTGKILYENKFEFKPTHKLVILTNNKPRIDLDGGIRRRLHLVPFTRSFEAVKNVNLKEELLEEAGSILQWMIEGCLAWERDGLAPPSSVVDYTNEYFEEADDLKNWIEQNCIPDPRAWTASSDLFADWKMFCQGARIVVGNQKDLVENLVREGFEKKKNASGNMRGIAGLKIRNSGTIH
jgi:putative DNA primase/helicase